MGNPVEFLCRAVFSQQKHLEVTSWEISSQLYIEHIIGMSKVHRDVVLQTCLVLVRKLRNEVRAEGVGLRR